MKKYRYFFHIFLSFFYPSVCFLCEKKTILGYPLCKNCYLNYKKGDLNKSRIKSIVLNENYNHYYLKELDNGLKDLIHRLKYRNFKIIGKVLGKLVGLKLKKLKIKYDYIVFVPLSHKKYLSRGYNQSEIIADAVGKYSKMRLAKAVLIKKADNKSQTKKDREERRENVKGVYGIKNSAFIKNKKILIIDDVYTTGATVEACIFELKKYKASIVDVLTLAKA